MLRFLPQALSHPALFPSSQEKAPPISRLSRQGALLLWRTKSLQLCQGVAEVGCTTPGEGGFLITGELQDLGQDSSHLCPHLVSLVHLLDAIRKLMTTPPTSAAPNLSLELHRANLPPETSI